MFILDPDADFLPIPDPGVKKAPDPGSGSATLQKSPVKILVVKENLRLRMWPNFIMTA